MIAGFGFDSISVERKNPIKGKVEIKYNLKIDSITEENLPVGSDKIPLKLNFNYRVEYAPKIGNIDIKGSLIYITDAKEGKNLIDEWKRKKKLGDERVAAAIFNTTLTRCNIKALSLTQEVGLPPHLPLPKAIPKGSAKNYIG